VQWKIDARARASAVTYA